MMTTIVERRWTPKSLLSGPADRNQAVFCSHLFSTNPHYHFPDLLSRSPHPISPVSQIVHPSTRVLNPTPTFHSQRTLTSPYSTRLYASTNLPTHIKPSVSRSPLTNQRARHQFKPPATNLPTPPHHRLSQFPSI